jgi:hypothetical protein
MRTSSTADIFMSDSKAIPSYLQDNGKVHELLLKRVNLWFLNCDFLDTDSELLSTKSELYSSDCPYLRTAISEIKPY